MADNQADIPGDERKQIERFRQLIERMSRGEGMSMSAEDFAEFLVYCRHARHAWSALNRDFLRSRSMRA
jgi:hypothetical protein